LSGSRGSAPMGGGGDAGGGIDPLMLQQLMSALQMAGTASGGSLMGGAGGGSLGQYGGGFGGGGYGAAGPTTQQAGTATGTSSASNFKTALDAARLGLQGYKLYDRLFGPTDSGTRGYVGGQDQLQGPNQSLSD